LFLGRPMPPARALVDAGAAIALATDFNPGSAFTESLPLVCSLAATQLKLAPAEALAAVTVNAAHVPRRADRIGRVAPGLRAGRREEGTAAAAHPRAATAVVEPRAQARRPARPRRLRDVRADLEGSLRAGAAARPALHGAVRPVHVLHRPLRVQAVRGADGG